MIKPLWRDKNTLTGGAVRDFEEWNNGASTQDRPMAVGDFEAIKWTDVIVGLNITPGSSKTVASHVLVKIFEGNLYKII